MSQVEESRQCREKGSVHDGLEAEMSCIRHQNGHRKASLEEDWSLGMTGAQFWALVLRHSQSARGMASMTQRESILKGAR